MADLIIRIGAKSDAFKTELDRVKNQTKALEDQLTSIAKQSAIAFAGFAAAIGGTVTAFATFDNEIRGVKTLLDDTSFGTKGLEAGFAQMRSELLAVAKTSTSTLTQLNKSLFDTVSAGISAADAVKVVGVASKLATAGLTDVATATDGVTSALNAYGLGADQAEVVAAKFFTAQKAGKTTIAELSNGFGLAGASAKSFGVSIDELLGAVAAVTTAGVKTNSAFTGVNAVLASVAKPTAEAVAEAKRLGIEFSATALRTKGFEQFLNDLTQAQGFTKNSVTQLFGSIEAQKTIFALTGSQAKAFANTVKNLGSEQQATAQFTEAFNTQNQSLASQFERFKNTVQVLAIQIGSQLAPAVSKALGVFNSFLDLLSENAGIAKTLAVVIGVGTALSGAALAASTGALAFLKLKNAMAAAELATKLMSFSLKGLIGATGIGLLVIAVTDLALNWETRINQMQAIWGGFVKFIQNSGSGLKNILQGIFDVDLDLIKKGFDEIKVAAAEGAAEADKIREDQKTKKDADAQADSEREKQKTENKAAENEAQIENEIVKSERLLELEAQRREIEIETKKTDDQLDQELELENENQIALINNKFRSDKFNLDRKIALDDLKKRQSENLLRLEEEKRYGKLAADAKAFFRTEEVKGTQEALGNLSTLTRSSNKDLFELGKAASFARATINISEGITKALAQGGIFGPILAATVAIAGAVELATISGQTFKAADGGLLTGGIPGVDSIPVLAQQGELIAPARNFDEVVNAVADSRNGERGGGGTGYAQIDINLKGDIAQFIEAEIVERQNLGISILPKLGV